MAERADTIWGTVPIGIEVPRNGFIERCTIWDGARPLYKSCAMKLTSNHAHHGSADMHVASIYGLFPLWDGRTSSRLESREQERKRIVRRRNEWFEALNQLFGRPYYARSKG